MDGLYIFNNYFIDVQVQDGTHRVFPLSISEARNMTYLDYLTPCIIFLSKGVSKNKRTAAIPVRTTNTIKNSYKL